MKKYAFPLANRLTERASYNQVFSKPVYITKTPSLSVLVGTSKAAQARLGVVIAKKNVRLAVNRNRLKRKVREAFRLQQHNLQGLDVVIIVKKDFNITASTLPELFLRVSNKCCKD